MGRIVWLGVDENEKDNFNTKNGRKIVEYQPGGAPPAKGVVGSHWTPIEGILKIDARITLTARECLALEQLPDSIKTMDGYPSFYISFGGENRLCMSLMTAQAVARLLPSEATLVMWSAVDYESIAILEAQSSAEKKQSTILRQRMC